jgi:hypothetical protein
VLSSPLAGPSMFRPEATNHENRSRDKQRRKVGDFQAWLAANFPDQLEAKALRRTPEAARTWVRSHFPEVGIDNVLALQEARFRHSKLCTRLLGIGAVEDVIGPGHTSEVLGQIIYAMQDLLPSKVEREAALLSPELWGTMITQARAAAAQVARTIGLEIRESPALPAFVRRP